MIKKFYELTKDFPKERRAIIEETKEELRRKADLYRIELNEIEQILGKALGYPYLDHTVCSQCDPIKGCTCGDPQVCIGEHVAVTIALEAATKINKLKGRVKNNDK